MPSTAIVIPVKGSEPKKRLAGLLSLRERRQLQVAMLEDTLQMLLAARMVRDTFVVSPDPQVLEFAERFGAKGVLEGAEEGVNRAVRLGLERTRRYAMTIVIPADLPMLSERDLRTARRLAEEGADVVISPSEAFDGTNLLLLRRGALELHYDDDSFRRHLGAAIARGMVPSVYFSPGVGLDIDTPKDVERFLAVGEWNSTMTFLARTFRRRAGTGRKRKLDRFLMAAIRTRRPATPEPSDSRESPP